MTDNERFDWLRAEVRRQSGGHHPICPEKWAAGHFRGVRTLVGLITLAVLLIDLAATGLPRLSWEFLTSFPSPPALIDIIGLSGLLLLN